MTNEKPPMVRRQVVFTPAAIAAISGAQMVYLVKAGPPTDTVPIDTGTPRPREKQARFKKRERRSR